MVNAKNIRFYYGMGIVILFLLLMILTSSCSATKKANRGIKKLEKLKLKYADVWQEVSTETVRIDTVIQEIHIPGEVQLVADSSMVDSLARQLEDFINNPKVPDTVKGDIIRETITRYIPRLVSVDSVQIDTLDIHFKFFYDQPSQALKYSITRDEVEIVKEKEVDKIAPIQYITVHKIPWWMWVIVVLCILIIGRLMFKSK